MPINTRYDGYELENKKASQVKDFFEGEMKVKSKGEAYIMKLTGQTSAEFYAYKERGSLVPAVKPTALAVTGAIMRRPPIVESSISSIESNIDGNNQDVKLFTSSVIKELLLCGGGGYLVEWDDSNNIPVAKAYPKPSLINYSDEYIVLAQNYTVADPKDRYIREVFTEYLELTFDENGNYIQNIWRDNRGKFEIFETLYPTKRGEALKEIPFTFLTIEGLGIKQSDPLLLDLSNVNKSQYRLTTDQRHGLHWTALPTFFLFGELTDAEGKRKKIKVGAGSFNHIEDEKARAELLEFSGAGLGAVKSAIDDDISTMASIGAKMLTNDSGGVKSAETSRIDASSETATLSTIANAVDLLMNRLFEIMDEWSGMSGSTYTINRDFIDIKVDPAALQAYLQTYMANGMSLDTFLNLLFKGELLPTGITPEEEADRIEQGGNDFDDNSTDDNLNDG